MDIERVVWVAAVGCVCAGLGFAAEEKYSGPRPPTPDLPYLVHADTLIATEAQQAREERHGKNDSVYIIAGAASPARTPLAEPIFLFESDKITAESLQLFRLEPKGGNREVVMGNRRSGHPLRVTVKPLGDRLYRIEVNEGLGLENGEYSLSPENSNAVFCFAVY
jgi:hypothetical protein